MQAAGPTAVRVNKNLQANIPRVQSLGVVPLVPSHRAGVTPARPVPPLVEPAAGLGPALTTSMPHGATFWAGSVAGEQGQTCPWHSQTHLPPVPAQDPKSPCAQPAVPVLARVSGCSRRGLVSCRGWGEKSPVSHVGERSEPR